MCGNALRDVFGVTLVLWAAGFLVAFGVVKESQACLISGAFCCGIVFAWWVTSSDRRHERQSERWRPLTAEWCRRRWLVMLRAREHPRNATNLRGRHSALACARKKRKRFSLLVEEDMLRRLRSGTFELGHPDDALRLLILSTIVLREEALFREIVKYL